VADRVVFLRPDAERIARVVRTVEAGSRNEAPLTFRRVETGRGGGATLIGTFDGEWAIRSQKTVNFGGSTVTHLVQNVSVDIADDPGNTARIVLYTRPKVGPEGVVPNGYIGPYVAVEIEQATQCSLVIGGVDLRNMPGYDSLNLQILGHEAGEDLGCATLRWYNVTECAEPAEDEEEPPEEDE
jgi:hypothetical protein